MIQQFIKLLLILLLSLSVIKADTPTKSYTLNQQIMQTILDQFAFSSAAPLWNLNYAQLKISSSQLLLSNDFVAIKIHDSLLGNDILVAYRQEGNIIYAVNKMLPSPYNSSTLYHSTSKDIVYNKQIIGKVTLYYDKNLLEEEKKITLNDDEKNFIRNHPIIKVSNELDWPPFDFTIGNKPQGYFIDLLSIIEKQSGLKFEFVNGYSWNELFKMFENKEIDLVHPVSKTPDREAKWIFSDPAYFYKTSFATRKNTKEIYSIEMLYGKKVGVGEGFSYDEFLNEYYPEIIAKPFKNISEALEALDQGKIDAVIDSEPVMKYLIKKNYYSNLTVRGWFKEHAKNTTDKLHFMTHKDKPELLSIINKSLKSIDIGQIEQLEKKWFGQISNNAINLTKDEIEYLEKKKTIYMCVLPQAMPYEGIDTEGQHEGMAKDFIDIFATRIGYPIKLFTTKTWAQSHEAIQEGKCDILPIAQQTKERATYLDFTPVFLNQQTVIATRTEELFISNLEEIQDKKVGIIKNYAHAKLIQSQFPNLDIIPLNNIEEGLEKVRKNEIYGYIDSLGSIGYALQKQGSYDIKVAGKIGFNLALSTATRKDEPLLNSIFTKAVDSLSKDEIQTIYNKWISIKFEQKVDYTFIYQIVSVVLFIVLIMFIWNRKLQSEINKRILIEEELKIAQQKAVDANNAKSLFLANMTHDIRTPMNGILGMNQLAINIINKDVNQAKDYISKSQSSANILLGIINDILDFSKIEAGKLDIENKPLSLRQMVSQLNDMFNYQCQEKSLEFVIQQEELLPDYIMGDQLRLSQVLSNLIGNAIKFTQKGSITFKIELINKTYDDIELKFSVTDTGRGIKKENLKKIFQSFSQENSTISQEYGGTGLGLAICKQLVYLMKGHIDVHSEYKKGSTFFFTIQTQLVKEEVIEELESKKKQEALEIKNKILPCKILLVEDNEINSELACKFLEDIVATIDIAKDGKEAIEKVFSNEYALVLMDIHMPVMDGYTATEHIRANHKYNTLPIVAMTANALKSDVKKCLDMGMNDHIAKPFSVLELTQKIHKWVNLEVCHEPINKEEITTPHSTVKSENSHFDSQAAIDRMIGRTDLYEDFLNEFLNSHTKDFQKAMIFLEDKKLEESQTTIHSLKGIVKTLGADYLGDLLLDIEQKIHKNLNIKQEIKVIEKELQEVIKEVKNYLENKTE